MYSLNAIAVSTFEAIYRNALHGSCLGSANGSAGHGILPWLAADTGGAEKARMEASVNSVLAVGNGDRRLASTDRAIALAQPGGRREQLAEKEE